MGDKVDGSQKTPFLAINAKGGEILSPKQKDRTTTFQNFKIDIFQIGMFFQLVSIFKLVSKNI
jgi:hypothetical protein